MTDLFDCQENQILKFITNNFLNSQFSSFQIISNSLFEIGSQIYQQ